MAKNSMGLKTKDKILNSAQLIFNEKGYEHTSVEEIAKHAGITKAMIYYHFNNKENIMLQLIKRLLSSIRKDLNAQVNTDKRTSSILMEEHIRNMINLWKDNKEIGAFIVTKALKNPKLFTKLQEIVEPFYNEVIKNNNGDKESDIDYKQNSEKYFKLFFFNTLPMILYPLFIDNFIMKYDMSNEKMNEIFTDNFIGILNNNVK